DVRFAWRVLRRAPVVSVVAIASLALGLGANTIALSLMDGLLARPLALPRPGELVNIRELWPGSRPRSEEPTWDFTGLRHGMSDTMTIAAIALFDRSNIAVSTPGGQRIEAGRSRVAIVSGNYFPMLQAGARIGRVLTPDDDRMAEAHPVAVISS